MLRFFLTALVLLLPTHAVLAQETEGCEFTLLEELESDLDTAPPCYSCDCCNYQGGTERPNHHVLEPADDGLPVHPEDESLPMHPDTAAYCAQYCPEPM